ncbi:disease resistance protein RGA5-like [Phragmites australis]|uniref:disease resistance protein RGA5-like n=1 Tax=Phragmites australis TaxID=29695 RepID=UPI002D78E4C2|nr:disease resistance protein RGA5-like [Phragmites australis]
MTRFYSLAEHPCRHSHLLPASSNIGLPPQAAEAGGLPIVGIDRPTKKLLRWLTPLEETDKSLRVMSIVGPAGMGKTTLALELRKLLSCQTSMGHYYFQCNVMAQASRNADRNELLLRDILSQISDPAPARASDQPQPMTLELLVLCVSERLQDKRYVILIDDMYMRRESEWEKIKGAFPDNNIGSRILITTRFPSIAWLCCSDSGGLVHVMKPLNKVDSERLLLLKAFGSVDVCLPDNVKIFVDKILMRCEGVPLFITGMADWLKQQLQEQQHQQEEEEEDEEHKKIAIYSEEQVPEIPKQIEHALSSTFDDIPYELRSLSLYMSMFPYGYKFEKDRPIMRWLCEDLTDDWDEWRNVADKEEAERYFSQLVDRNVITLVAENCKSNPDEAEACQWHVNHFMQQFLASKSAETGFAFTSATGHGNKTRIPRRLALHHPDPCLPSLFETIDFSQTRSLAVSGAVSRIALDKFNLVVLDLEGWENLKDEDLLQVCRSKMFFLQYLSVRNTRVSKLPHEIKELCSLMMLDLRGTRIRQLPKQIVGLRSTLRALLLGSEGMINPIEPATTVPHDVQHLHMLSTLATIDLSEHPASFVEALGAMENLRVLAITWSFHQCTDGAYRKALLSSIKKWKWLKSLTIHCGLGCSMEFLGVLSDPPQNLEKFKVTAGRFATVPKWIRKFKFLSFVQITVCRPETGDLKILRHLLNLQCLVLGLDFIPREDIVIESVGFRELQRFSVDCPVPWLTFRTGAMRKLTYLQLKFCACPASSQTSVPSGIGSLQSLMEVALCYNVRYTNSTNVKVTVKAMREAVAEHDNQIDLFINGVQNYDVQAADEDTESAIRTQSGIDAGTEDDAQAIDVETGRTTTEIQSEIEIEAKAGSDA